jgi:predicted MPP superfamily phosphohydrolase
MTIARRAHGRPGSHRATISRRGFLQAGVAAGVGVATGGAAYGFLYERHAVARTEQQALVSGLPPALEGFTIGMLTDIHRSGWVSAEDVEAAVDRLMEVRPDLIVLGGDYVTWGNRAFVGPAAAALSGLRAPHGVFAVLGNHDDDHDMPAALAANGVEVLRDARTRLTVRHERIDLVGIRFWTRRVSDLEPLIRGAGGTVILLAHDPRRFTEATTLKIPLVLSGHTHGGQIVLPGLGPIAAQKFPVIAGLARRGDTTLFVSRGVGTVYVPVRINCAPEAAVIRLTRAGG